MSQTGAEYVASGRKRALDLAGGSLLTLILTPPAIPIMGVSMLEHRTLWPIYRQKRPGKDGKLRTVSKIKTIEETADPHEREAIWSGTYHPDAPPGSLWLRRKGLDEIPQLLAVVAGSMSLVGIRPLPPSTRDYWQSVATQDTFSEWDELSRLNSGLTGLDQLYGKLHEANGKDPNVARRRMELGIRGFHNASFANDMRILKATPLILMFPDLASLPRLEEAAAVA